MRVVLVLLLASCSFRPGALGATQDDAAAPTADTAPPPNDAALDAALDAMPDTGPPPLDCEDARDNGLTEDGVITIDPDGPGGAAAPFSVYCDMTTAGGGWTLAYAYGFTNYAGYQMIDNAVTPRPNWPFYTLGETSVPISTTAPQSPQTGGAIDFALWPQLGGNLLVTSNINHWLSCTPGTGSLVTGTAGTMTCTMVQQVATACTTILPTSIGVGNGRGPWLQSANLYYYWDGSLGNNWPTHDPCGANAPNQLAGVSNPRGQIYLRR